MSDPFIAEIRVMPYNLAPRGWASCDGQLMPIAQNTALFSLIGIYFGGNGTSNFALPDLRGNFAMGTGQGPGLSERVLGEAVGAASVTLLPQEMPSHTHGLQAGGSPAATSPAAALMSTTASGNAYRAGGATTPMAPSSVGPTGASLPHENRQPFLAVPFCIALQGSFPSRG